MPPASWGPNWAGNGRFKVAFNTCSLATAPDIYGVVWERRGADGAWPPVGLKPTGKCPNGFEYQVGACYRIGEWSATLSLSCVVQ